jgi:hypothetical protein
MQLLVSFKFRRDQMRCDRKECGVHAAPPSTFHQQPHYGGTSALPFQLKCSVSDVVPTTHSWLQIFRKLDGLAGDIERSQPPVDLWRKFVYCTSLSGSILGSVDHMKQEGQFSSFHVQS